tara:strand:- start:497 stop:814 length:318 start_codon:yes stop_codon:yes gene_type:complete
MDTRDLAACAATILRETLGISKMACAIYDELLVTVGSEVGAKVLSNDALVVAISISSFSELDMQPEKTRVKSNETSLYKLLLTSLPSIFIKILRSKLSYLFKQNQ